jgi:NAD(P)-dependent dehydrogenase (short-subunit alcohol dehydrogenase family)
MIDVGPRMTASALVGNVALVIDGGKEVGAAVARSLSARNISVVVFGPNEHALARVVGEIAASGGKARHLRGDANDENQIAAGIEKAITSFGEIGIVVADENSLATFRVAASRIKSAGRLIAVGSNKIAELALELKPRKITCNSISADSLEPEAVAEVVAFLCSRAADHITGHSFEIS